MRREESAVSNEQAVSLHVEDVHKSFVTPHHTLEVLRGVSFDLTGGEALAITGPSGSGKSTLLHLIGTLDQPSSGRITIGGQDPFALGEPELARFRNHTIGFVFQEHYLLPQYSVLENVILPTLAFPAADGDAKDRAVDLLSRVGLEDRLFHRPAELSGGERQRVAVARALINAPSLLLCDEPTGSLDPQTAETVADLLLSLHGEQRTILIVVTHSEALASRFTRRCAIENGTCT